MLSNIPRTVNRAARMVVRNHPNTFSCQVFRKDVTPRQGEGTMGGLSTLGGLGVMDSGDEETYSYRFLGNGYAMPVEPFAPSPMMDRQDAHNGAADVFTYLIAPEADEGEEGHFTIKTKDVVYLLLGDGPAPARLAFEVGMIEAMINIPPFSCRYLLNRRDDLHIPAGEAQADQSS